MENLSPTKNPKTTIPGYIFIGISTVMFVIQYVLPAFMVLKQEPVYPWYTPWYLLGAGIILLFLTDAIFERIFSVAISFFKKKAAIEDKEQK